MSCALKRKQAVWIGAPEMARRARITRQAACKALRRAAAGKPWNGAKLIVQKVHGPGGKAGAQYIVNVASLPSDMQHA